MKSVLVLLIPFSGMAAESSLPFRIVSFSASPQIVVQSEGRPQQRLTPGEQLNNWTFMGIAPSNARRSLAVFEDFSQTRGSLVFAGEKGVELELTKSLEPTFAAATNLYLGHTLKEVFNSERDLLADDILAKPGDPDFNEVASCFPPIAKSHVYTFLGTHESFEKVGIFYGGGTPNFDPAAYVPAMGKIRDQGQVWDGLVGGWLPCLRFVYPEKPGDWSEMTAFAPFRQENGNNRVQPVWYRVCRIQDNKLQWVRYFDSYHPFPPRTEYLAATYYHDLLALRSGWDQLLAGSMRIDVPDPRVANLARHSLVRDLITRIGPFPKYGVFDRSYGGSEHDGFPDTFNADTTAMLEWGLFTFAGQYISNYFTAFVRDDGSILYRGPETGQFGRMLTVVAQYANYTGDDGLLLKLEPRIDAITRLLLRLRGEARQRSTEDPAYGMIAGWSEADACLDPEPARYMQPYFSNSSEAQRGLRDLGRVWERMGRKRHRAALSAWGLTLQAEAQNLDADLQRAIARSMLTNTAPPCLPAIAGVHEPFHLAVARDKLDPQFRSYRAYMEMLYSGNLTREQVGLIAQYRSAHGDTILGIPTCYGYHTHELAGFLSYGHGYGLLQHDFIREFLLEFYGLIAHQYTRGTWTAPETRPLDPKQFAAPYCTPAQLTEPLLTRWMLVFEDPAADRLWLAKGTPRDWLQDGKTIRVDDAPTRWGRVSYALRSRLAQHRIECDISMPPRQAPESVRLRLRVPEGRRISSVTINGRKWSEFDPESETVTLPCRPGTKLACEVLYAM